MAQGVPARLTRAQGRKFGFTLAPAFLLFATLMVWRGHTALAWIAAALGVLLALAAALVPEKLGAVERAWMALAHAISRLTTPVILGVVWFVVLTPIGLLRRTVGGNPLKRRETDGGYWVHRAEGDGRSDLHRQF